MISGLIIIWYLDLANHINAFPIHVGYGVLQVLVLVAFAYIRSCILKNKENGSVTVVFHPLSTDEEPKRKNDIISIQEYDKRELNELLLDYIIDVAILIVLYNMWLMTLQNFIVDSIELLEKLFTSSLFQIYILKRPTEGKLKRPRSQAGLQKNNQDEEERNGIVELQKNEKVVFVELNETGVETKDSAEEEPVEKAR